MMVHSADSAEARVLRVGAWASIALGATALGGYIFHIDQLTTPASALFNMRPVTATVFILVGLAMIAMAAVRARPTLVLAGAAAVITLLSLIAEFTDQGLLIDQLPWPGLFNAPPGVSVNMSPLTAVGLLTIALVLVALASGRWRSSFEWLLILPVTMGIASCLALAYGVHGGPVISNVRLPALHTSVAITVIAYIVAMAIQNTLMHRITFERSPGGRLLRSMIPFVVFVLPAAAWIAIYGERRGWWDHGNQTILLVVFIGACLVTAMVYTAGAVDSLDRDRRRVLQELHDLNAELNARVEERTATLAQAQEALTRSAARYQRLFEAAPMGMVERDGDGRITMVNRRWADLHDISVDDALGHRVPPGLHPDDVPRVLQMLSSSEGFAVEHYRLVDASGEVRYVACDMVKEFDAAGDIIGSVSAIRDRTTGEHGQRREQAVRQVGAAVLGTLDQGHLADTVLAIIAEQLDVEHTALVVGRHDAGDVDVAYVRSSPGAAEASAEDVGEVAARLFAERQRFGLDRKGADVMADAALQAAAGEHRLAALRTEPIALGENRAGLLVIGTTSPRLWTALDVELLLTMANVFGIGMTRVMTYEAQRQVAARLEQLDEAKSDFISSVSHELRTPLTSVLGYLDLVLDGDAGDLDAGVAKMLRIVRRNGERMAAFIEDLLVLSRLERWQTAPDLTAVDVEAVIDEVLTSLRPLAGERRISLSSEVDHRLPSLQANARHLEQVVRNLVANAIKFTPERGSVTIAALAGQTANGRPAVTLRVTDTGIGIPADEVPKTFERFFRASNAEASAIQGTGLGLAIVARIVEQHHGTITVDSVVDQGTTFTVTIPLVPPGGDGAELTPAAVTFP